MDINQLIKLNEQSNDGRGVCCVQSFINCILHNNVEMALQIYKWDGDKIRAYPKIQQWFDDNVGCRTHLIINCDNRLCQDLKRYNDERLGRKKW